VIDANVLVAKLAELSHRLDRLRRHRPADPAALAADADLLDMVSFNLLLAVQVCLDIASHIIADEGWPVAATLGESFQRLHEKGVITGPTAAAMRQAAAFRNVLVHDYGSARLDLIHAAATRGIGDLERFALEVGGWANRRAPGTDRPAAPGAEGS
jgi:uncharacterized protein YutE (UPF0331/DUF86 family)